MPLCPRCERDVEGARFCPYDGTPLAHIGRASGTAEIALGDRVDGRYVIERELGRGAAGVVYQAYAPALDQSVAVKVLRPDVAQSDRQLARFAREARASSRVDHPNVVRVFDFGFAEEGYYFLVMELLRGSSLAELLHQHGRFSPGRALQLLAQIAAGLARAHALGVVHRDLKPENVMVRRDDGERATLVDFGLSKSVDGWEGGKLTREGTLVGTPDYMSPEQWLGKAVDARTDVYAFGVLAYEVLSGERPFEGATIVVKMQQHLYEGWTPLDARGLRLPAGLGALVDLCLAKDADARPHDMGGVARELARIREDLEAVEGVAGREEALPQMTELVLADLGALSASSLVEEIERLRTVRRHRLKQVVSRALHVLPSCGPLIARIEADEHEVGLLEQAHAVHEAELRERRAARAQREAELRQAMLEASLEVAVQRDGLPRRLGSWEGDTETTLATARTRLLRAEKALAGFLNAPDPGLADAWDAHDAAAQALAAADRRLQERYDELEAALRGRPDGARVASTLARIDGAIAAYRAQLRRA